MKITKIVVTGGPCAGKTTAMSWIQNAFTQLGYTVLFVPETATELISGGVAPWTCGTNLDYQKCQFELQLEKEKIFDRAARTMPGDKILVVCDRGALDNKVYMDSAEYAQTLAFVGRDEAELIHSYDAIFHLVTAARGAEQFYTTENNQARIETVDQAIALDDKLIAAWTAHPHLRVIYNSTDFEFKMKRLISEISSFLGEPVPVETERKFLIAYPSMDWLEHLPDCQKIEMVQTYLKSTSDDEVCVRQRGIQDSSIYFQTTRRKVSDTKHIKLERRLSQDEYLSLLNDADPTKRPVRKTRYRFTYHLQPFEIDVFPFWKDRAITRVRLDRDTTEIIFPEQLRVLEEITADPDYHSITLASFEE